MQLIEIFADIFLTRPGTSKNADLYCVCEYIPVSLHDKFTPFS